MQRVGARPIGAPVGNEVVGRRSRVVHGEDPHARGRADHPLQTDSECDEGGLAHPGAGAGPRLVQPVSRVWRAGAGDDRVNASRITRRRAGRADQTRPWSTTTAHEYGQLTIERQPGKSRGADLAVIDSIRMRVSDWARAVPLPSNDRSGASTPTRLLLYRPRGHDGTAAAFPREEQSARDGTNSISASTP